MLFLVDPRNCPCAKDDVFGKFKDFELLVENQAETKIKCLRTGRGEFDTSNTFQTFLKYHNSSRMRLFHRKTK
jgi:hypothetical protein